MRRTRCFFTILGIFLVAGAVARALPVDVPGLTLWLQADGALTKDVDNFVSVWNDTLTANNTVANNAVRNVAHVGKHPVWTANVFGHQPALYFDGINDHLTLSPNPISAADTALTVFTVIRTADAAGGLLAWYGNHRWYAVGLYLHEGQAAFDVVADSSLNSGITRTVLPANDEATHILSAVYDGAERSIFLDGLLGDSDPRTGAIGSGDKGTSGLLTIGVVGLDTNSGNPSALRPAGIASPSDPNWYFNGYIGEMLVYNTALTDAQRREVEIYLLHKYVFPEPSTFLLLCGATSMALFRRDRRRPVR